MINLNMSEEQFLKFTLRKIFALMDYYKQINGIEGKDNKSQQVFIDQVLI